MVIELHPMVFARRTILFVGGQPHREHHHVKDFFHDIAVFVT
jgi:hypothetical protein